jgi:tetratricopeptide (TPR) repeat protein
MLSQNSNYTLSTFSPPSPTATTVDWLNYANLLWRKDRFQAAVTAFEIVIKMLESEPELPERQERFSIAYFGLGLAWEKQNNFELARIAFAEAVKIDPGSSQSWRHLGLSQGQLQRYEEALVSYQRAIVEAPKADFVLYEELGSILNQLKLYPAAVDAYTRSIDLQPSHTWAYNNRGNAYRLLQQYPQALADLNRAIQLAPRMKEAYYNRGIIYKDLQQYPQALADYQQALQLDPRYSDVYFNRGIVYTQLQQYPQAMADYQRAIDLDPQSTLAYYNRGFTHHQLQQYPQAIADYDQAIKIDPHYANAYANRGAIYLTMAQYLEAIFDLEKAAKLFQAQNNTAGYQQVMGFLKQLGY